VPAISIKKYVSLYAGFYPLFDENAFSRYLHMLDVQNEGKLNTFSFGQQKKFVIAFALACNTKVLLLDEPTNGLDIPSKTRFRKLIAAVMDSERTILISTHQIRDLENLIDNVIIVDNGRLALSSSIDTISSRLSFKTVDRVTDDDVLYHEPALNGTSVIVRNSTEEDTRVNLEQLFNAVTEKPEISNLINNMKNL
jgi:ABC-2 type transport system ATP-binding protein